MKKVSTMERYQNVAKKEKGRKWDGRSRVSTKLYRKRFNEITWSNIDEVHRGLMRDKEKNLKNEKE